MGVTRLLGPVAVVAVLAGCAAPGPAPSPAPPPAAQAPLAAGPTDGPVPLPVPLPGPVPVEPSAPGAPEPLPIDGSPLDVATVPGCGSGCEVRFDIALPDGGRFAGVQGADGPGLLVRRTADGGVRTAEPVPGAPVTGAVCDAQRCVAVVGTDAVVVDVDDLTVTGRAAGDTPGARPIDLDGDDRVDLALPQSTSGPGRTGAPTHWQTWRQTPEGDLTPTGCGPPAGGEPTQLESSPCPPA